MSDNATNFVGAKNELHELDKFIKTNRTMITQWLGNQEVTWKFIPPHSPHFGGILEAAVQSFKHHLYC